MDLIIQIFAVLSVLSCLFMAAYSYRKEVKREKLAYLNARAEVAGMFDRLDCRVDNLYDYRLPAMNAPRGDIKFGQPVWEQPKSDPATAYLDDVKPIGLDDVLLEEMYRQALEAMSHYNEQIVRSESMSASIITRPERIVRVPPIPPYGSSDL